MFDMMSLLFLTSETFVLLPNNNNLRLLLHAIDHHCQSQLELHTQTNRTKQSKRISPSIVFPPQRKQPTHSTMEPQPPLQARTFHLFAYLNEDIKMTILSFLADAPFESMPDNYPTSTLTHDLPRVSQKFRLLASSDVYWKEAMVRQTKREPFLWKSALRKLRNGGAAHEEEKEVSSSASPQELVEDAYKNTNHSSYKKLYQNVVTHYLRFKGPVFAMEGQGTFRLELSLRVLVYCKLD